MMQRTGFRLAAAALAISQYLDRPLTGGFVKAAPDPLLAG